GTIPVVPPRCGRRAQRLARSSGGRALVEGQRHDLCGDRLLANLDGQYRTRLAIVGRDIGHGDRLGQRRGLRPAGHDAGASLAGIDRVAMAGDPAARHHEADEALVWTFVRNALRSRSVSGPSTSAARGPWMATSDVASDRSSSTARQPPSREASSSETIVALPALATTRNRSGPSR